MIEIKSLKALVRLSSCELRIIFFQPFECSLIIPLFVSVFINSYSLHAGSSYINTCCLILSLIQLENGTQFDFKVQLVFPRQIKFMLYCQSVVELRTFVTMLQCDLHGNRPKLTTKLCLRLVGPLLIKVLHIPVNHMVL